MKFKAPVAAKYKSKTSQMLSADSTKIKASKVFRGAVPMGVEV